MRFYPYEAELQRYHWLCVFLWKAEIIPRPMYASLMHRIRRPRWAPPGFPTR